MAVHSRRKDRRNPASAQAGEFMTLEEQSIHHLKLRWLARAFLYCNGISLLIKERYRCDDFLKYLDLSDGILEDLKTSEIREMLQSHCEPLLDADFQRQGVIFDNLENISRYFGLSDVEAEIMLFATLLVLDCEYGNCYDLFGYLGNRSFISYLGRILDIPEKQVSEALQRSGLLSYAGLLKLESDVKTIDRKFDMLGGLAGALDNPQPNIESLFSNYIVASPAPQLTPKHYRHIEAEYERLLLYLQNVSQQRVKGANILIYGPPGTGKTQLVRVLAEQLNITLNEISVEDQEGSILSGKERVTACQLAQKFLEKREKQCLLFDEIEDLFEGDLFSQMIGKANTSSRMYKAWFNQLLENNAVPTFWLSNQIDALDQAFLRRFDIVLELAIPPRSTRQHILSETLQNTGVSNAWIERMANLEQLPPAVIGRAARVNNILGESTPNKVEAHLESIIGNTLKAMGHQHQAHAGQNEGFYDPTLINTTAPLDKIANGLKISGSGRLCLYGPPGSGKSAYAGYLAEFLNRPLIAKRASDIIDCYVGETEKNIARMFSEAQAERSVLLLDEADSFLRDRNVNRNSWETTQVNELLVQMENFPGIFICSTNLMTNLDAAALRRFDFKLEFTYLKSEQAWNLLKGYLGEAINSLSPRKKGSLKKRLAAIDHLTPGDFATVTRKLTVLGEQHDADLFIGSLQEETNFKSNKPKRSIGFAAKF